MSDNGKKKRLLIRVELEDGKMDVTMGECNMALLSHAIRLASLELDNLIIGKRVNEQSTIQVPEGLIR